MKTIVQILICCVLCVGLKAQVLPRVNDFPELGLKFEIQKGWTAQQQGEIVMMGHETIPGLIIMSFNDAQSAEVLKQQALEGVVDQSVNLRAVGEFTIKNNSQVSGYYEGTWDGANVKCFAIGKINTFGAGVNVMAVTTNELFSNVHKEQVNALAETVKFYKPKVSDQSTLWRNKLVPSLVKYISSSYSSDFSEDQQGQVLLKVSPYVPMDTLHIIPMITSVFQLAMDRVVKLDLAMAIPMKTLKGHLRLKLLLALVICF